MRAGLPLMENMLMSLANNVSISLTAAASATDAAIQKRIMDRYNFIKNSKSRNGR